MTAKNDKFTYTFDHEDKVDHRVYYRHSRGGLYCFADVGKSYFPFFRCSGNGLLIAEIGIGASATFDRSVLPSHT